MTRSPFPARARLRTAAALMMLGTMMGVGATAAAQGFPTRPITLVVPYPPGGSSDTIGRAVAPKLAEKLA